MYVSILTSWEILQHLNVLWTGDLRIDCSWLVLMMLLAIRMKR